MLSDIYFLISQLIHRYTVYYSSYENCCKAILAAYGYIGSPHYLINVVSVIRDLMDILTRISYSYPESKDIILNFISKADTIFVVDNLGLPEIMYLAKNNYIDKFIFLVNPLGNTAAFKEILGISTLNELANFSGGHLIRKLDNVVDNYFSIKCMAINDLISEMYRKLALRIQNYIFELKPSRILLIADHGYDIEKCSEKLFRLCHGFKCKRIILSKLLPVLMIHH